VSVWHLLADPTARYQDLGAGYYASRIDKDRRPATTSGSCKPWGSPSPSPGSLTHPYNHIRSQAGFAGCCRLPSQTGAVIFRSG
jgi:hypothetical protein